MRIRFRSNSSVASVRTNRVSDKCWEYCIVKIREQCTSKKSIRLLPILASESWSTTEINNADFFVKTTCYLFWRDGNLFLLTSETFPTKHTSFSVCWGSISAFTLGACMSKQVEIVQRNDQKRKTPGKICRAKTYLLGTRLSAIDKLEWISGNGFNIRARDAAKMAEAARRFAAQTVQKLSEIEELAEEILTDKQQVLLWRLEPTIECVHRPVPAFFLVTGWSLINVIAPNSSTFCRLLILIGRGMRTEKLSMHLKPFQTAHAISQVWCSIYLLYVNILSAIISIHIFLNICKLSLWNESNKYLIWFWFDL